MTNKKDIKNGISLCMIVKNEEKMIKQTITSVHDIVNEVIVVDTGSNDKTCKCAQSSGAKVFSFAWCDDFSTARNFSLQQAHYTWILVLDADEIIAKRDLGKILRIVKDDNCDAVVFSQRNYCNSPDTEGWCANTNEYEEGNGYSGFFDIPVVRLFRNNAGIYFQGLVHEVVDDTIKGMRKRYLPVPIHHYARFEDVQFRENKSSFYLTLLLKQLERDPNDSQTWFHIGRQYYTLGKFAEAIVFLRKVIDGGSKCEMAYDNLASTYFNCGMYDEARDVLERLLHLNPRYHEAYSTLGVVYYELGNTRKAIDFLKHGIDLSPRSFKPYFNLAATFYRERQYNEAHTYIQKAERLAPYFPRIKYFKFFILIELGCWHEALNCAQTLKNLDLSLYHNIEEKYSEIKRIIASQKGVPCQ